LVLLIRQAVYIVACLFLRILQHTTDLQLIEAVIVLAMVASFLLLNRLKISAVCAGAIELANPCNLLRVTALLVVELHDKRFPTSAVLERRTIAQPRFALRAFRMTAKGSFLVQKHLVSEIQQLLFLLFLGMLSALRIVLTVELHIQLG